MMSGKVITHEAFGPSEGGWIRRNIFLGKTPFQYFKSLLTPFNIICGAILAVGIPVMIWRLVAGLGATTNLSNTNPWGFWLGFDMFAGVAVATGGFVVGTAVYIFGAEEYRPLVRPAILTGFLGYFFAIVGLIFDLGRPWRIYYPFFVSLGTASVLFLVAEHLALYLMAQLIEWFPAIAEWLGLKKVRSIMTKLTVGSVILGAVLVTGHQSALGAIYLIMPSRLHPLWYTTFIPFLFYISAIAGGIAMLVIESMISHKVFGHQISHEDHEKFDRLTLGLGKAAAIVLVTYFVLKIIGVAHGQNWDLLGTSWGTLFGVEMLGFVLLPIVMYYIGVVKGSARLVRITSVLTVVGVIFNRFIVSMAALNWNAPEVYIPKWSEVMLSLTLVTIGVLIFRWVVNRMPILYRLPDYNDGH